MIRASKVSWMLSVLGPEQHKQCKLHLLLAYINVPRRFQFTFPRISPGPIATDSFLPFAYGKIGSITGWTPSVNRFLCYLHRMNSINQPHFKIAFVALIPIWFHQSCNTFFIPIDAYLHHEQLIVTQLSVFRLCHQQISAMACLLDSFRANCSFW